MLVVVAWFLGGVSSLCTIHAWHYAKFRGVLGAGVVLIACILGFRDRMTHVLVAAVGFFFCLLGSAIVAGDANQQTKDTREVVAVKFLNVRFAQGTDNQGIVLTVKGTKPEDLSVDQVLLSLEGDEFWNAVNASVPSAVITMAKWTFLPLKLIPGMMKAADIREGSANMQTQIRVGTKENGTFGALHDTIRTRIQGLQKSGDPQIHLRFEFTDKKTGADKCLFVLKIRPSELLLALEVNDSDYSLIQDEKKDEQKGSNLQTQTKVD